MKPPTTECYAALDSTTFHPADYNRTYYSEVMQDEAALIEWQSTRLDERIRAHLARWGEASFRALREVGSGPAVHHLFALEKYVDTIHLSDFLPANLEEIQSWVNGDDSAHVWTPFVEAILRAEGAEVDGDAVEWREKAVRTKIASFDSIDLELGTGIGAEYSAPFVASFFVADSATDSKDVFKAMTANAFGLVEPGRLWVSTYLGGCEAYLVGDRWLVSANLTHSDIRDALTGAVHSTSRSPGSKRRRWPMRVSTTSSP